MIDISSSAVAVVETASAPYLGRWHRLVSTTNWEKGRIIYEWREALASTGAAASEYADEMWSRRVGNVTGQHVGRLRRVYERFGSAAADFPGLYWSHFQSALDWDDAEMWLEGAVQSRWSVAEMRRQRFTARAAVEGREVDDAELASDSPDEDFAPSPLETDEANSDLSAVSSRESIRAAAPTENGGERSRSDDPGDGESDDDDSAPFEDNAAARPAPFAHLAELPEDLAEAFETFKLAIVRHRLSGWRDAARDDVLAAIDALRELALAPVD